MNNNTLFIKIKPKILMASKTVKIMRLITFFLLCCIYSYAGNSYSQNAKINIEKDNVKLEDVLNEIEEQTNYLFIYNNQVDTKKNVSVKASNKPVSSVLKQLFKDSDIEYVMEGSHILLARKNEGEREITEPQQNRNITGKIIDSNGEPLIGVTVALKNNTSIGTLTDIDGNYSLNVPNGSTILFSYVGFLNQEIKVGNHSVINVTLQEDSQTLDEVVVVGYGVQKKVNLTGAIATIDSKSLENRPMSNVSAGLAGLLPGVTITQESGKPGSDVGKIRVRGTGTLNDANPMIIVDGVEATMNNIDPNDIESLTVLKDAASAAIYGSKASNGVVLITTKRGKAGKSIISYSGNFGWQSPTKLPKYLGSAEYAELYNEALRNDDPNSTPQWTAEDIQKFRDRSDPYGHPDTDWQDLLYKGSGFQTSNNLSISGGGENVRYMTSVGYLNQEGVIKHTSKNQYNVRSNLDIKPIDRLEVGVNLSFSRIDLEEPTNSYVGGGSDQIFRQVNIISPWVPYKRENGDYGFIADGNPIAWIDLDQKIKRKRDYFLGIGSLQYNILNGLKVKGVLSYKTYTEDKNEFIKDIVYNPTETATNAAARKYQGPNKMTQTDNSNHTVTTDLFANYDKTFNKKHTIGLMAGFHSEYYHKKLTLAYRQNFPSNDLEDINAGSTAGQRSEGYTREVSMLSWFGRATYDYEGKYLLEANFRYDGSSRFAKDNRWGFFPSFSAGWRISEESFMKPFKNTISNLKIRGSWGKLGNQSSLDDKDPANGFYPTIPVLSLGKDYSYPFGGTMIPGGAIKYARNPNLKWESSRTWDLGFDISLFNQLNVTFDYYNRLTSDILMKVPTPDTYALKDFWDNVGEVSNKGIEVAVQWNKQIDKVALSIGGNFSYNKNEIKELADQNEIIDGRDIKRVGSALNSLYGYKTDGLFQSQAEIDAWAKNGVKGTWKPGDIKYVDTNGDGIVNAADRVIIGTTDPKFIFGLTLGATYKGFDISMLLQGTGGGKGYLDPEAYGQMNGFNGKPTTFWRDRWTPENTNTDVPRLSKGGGPSYSNVISDRWILNSSYLRMKNLQVGYTIPTTIVRKLQLTKVRLYYSAQNLFTITNFAKGWDPESPVGRGSHYPQVMVNSFGINVTF